MCYSPQIFQMVAAVLSTDLLRLIPGSKVVFFEALHAQTNVQYQLADEDKWCLLHANRWQHLKHASAVLDDILASPPTTADDLRTRLDEYSTEFSTGTASEPEQVNAVSSSLHRTTTFVINFFSIDLCCWPFSPPAHFSRLLTILQTMQAVLLQFFFLDL